MQAALDPKIAGLQQILANRASHRIDYTAVVGRKLHGDAWPQITQAISELEVRCGQTLQRLRQHGDRRLIPGRTRGLERFSSLPVTVAPVPDDFDQRGARSFPTL